MIHTKKKYDLIISCNNYIWEKRILERDIKEWIGNFTGKVTDTTNEKEIAYNLLSNFIYYNEGEIKYLCKNIYTTFRQNKIKEFASIGNSLEDAETLFEEYISKCKITYIGRPGESGSFILYYFRQMNRLPMSMFLERWDDINDDTCSIIFVDDFIGTGNTTIRYWESSIIQDTMNKIKNIDFHYLVPIGLKRGIDNVIKSTDFKIICPQIFDDEYKVFSDESLVFTEKGKRDCAKQVCESYGSELEGIEHALGYKDSEALIGFHHNIPNNTLPVIWSNEKGWHPIFPRIGKIYK